MFRLKASVMALLASTALLGCSSPKVDLKLVHAVFPTATDAGIAGIHVGDDFKAATGKLQHAYPDWKKTIEKPRSFSLIKRWDKNNYLLVSLFAAGGKVDSMTAGVTGRKQNMVTAARLFRSFSTTLTKSAAYDNSTVLATLRVFSFHKGQADAANVELSLYGAKPGDNQGQVSISVRKQR